MKMLKRFWVALWAQFLLAVPAAFAVASVPEEGIFEPPATDVSMEYLRKIFGSVGQALATGPGAIAKSQLLGEMFAIFNTAMLIFAGGFVLYSVGTSVINTAQDGSPMGNKMSTWMIFRIVGGTSMLIPKFNGYSLVQVIVMYAVVSGVGLADTVWTRAIDYLQKTGGITVNTETSTESADLPTLTWGGRTVSTSSQDAGVGANVSAINFFKSALCLEASSAGQERIHKESGSRFFNTYRVRRDSYCGLSSYAVSVCYGSDSNPTLCGAYGWNPSPSGVTADKKGSISAGINNVVSETRLAARDVFRRANGATSITDRNRAVTCTSSSTCRPAKSIVSGAARYFSDTLLARRQEGASPDAGWAQQAKTHGWVLAASYYKDLVGGGARRTDGITYADINQVKFRMASALDDTLIPTGKEKNTYAAISSQLDNYIGLSNSLVIQIVNARSGGSGGSHSLFGGSGSEGDYLDQVTHKLRNHIIVQPFVPSTGNFRARSSVTNIKGGGKIELDIAQTNMMRMIQTVIRRLVGFAPLESADEVRCKSAAVSCPGPNCFESAYTNGCISHDGKGILGAIAADRKIWGLAGESGRTIDPLLNLTELGQSMIDSAVLYWVDTINEIFKATYDLAFSYSMYMLIVAVGSAIVSGGASYFKGSKAAAMLSAVAEAGASISAVIFKLMFQVDMAGLTLYLPLGAAMALMLFMLGISMGIYAPFIPFILFLFGVIGWLGSVIEAMVAAPLVALGVTHPEGHDLLGKSEQATMLLFSVFVRPVTMVIGLFVAIVLTYISVSLLNYGFVNVLAQYLSTSYDGSAATTGKLVGMVGVLLVYAYVLLAVLNQCFALIHQVPDKIMMWVGGPMGQSGAAQALGEVKQGVSQSGQMAGQGAQQAAQTPPQLSMQEAKAPNFKKDKDDDNKSASASSDSGGGAK